MVYQIGPISPIRLICRASWLISFLSRHCGQACQCGSHRRVLRVFRVILIRVPHRLCHALIMAPLHHLHLRFSSSVRPSVLIRVHPWFSPPSRRASAANLPTAAVLGLSPRLEHFNSFHDTFLSAPSVSAWLCVSLPADIRVSSFLACAAVCYSALCRIKFCFS